MRRKISKTRFKEVFNQYNGHKSAIGAHLGISDSTVHRYTKAMNGKNPYPVNNPKKKITPKVKTLAGERINLTITTSSINKL